MNDAPMPAKILDTTGLICPEPLMMLHQAVRKAQSGDQIKMLATDPSAVRDVTKFCMHLQHVLISQETLDTTPVEYHFLIQKK